MKKSRSYVLGVRDNLSGLHQQAIFFELKKPPGVFDIGGFLLIRKEDYSWMK